MTPGAIDPQYVAARRALLNALEALVEFPDAVVLAGAQAIYFHVGEAELAVAPFTTDADLAVDPSRLPEQPLLREALDRAKFTPNVNGQPGAFVDPTGIEVDLLVPEELAVGGGSRDARLEGQTKGTARRVLGLEGVLVDRELRTVSSLDPEDARAFDVPIGGPAGLLIAKAFKLGERLDQPSRLEPKDSLDCLRLLRMPADGLASHYERVLTDPLSQAVAAQSLDYLAELYAAPNAVGAELAVAATAPLEDEAVIRASCVALTAELLASLGRP